MLCLNRHNKDMMGKHLSLCLARLELLAFTSSFSSTPFSIRHCALHLQLRHETQESCPGKSAVCLSEKPQRVRKKSPVRADHDACSRQDGYCLGSGTGAAHASLLLQGFFTCLQNLKTRTIQQRPILQYISQISLS